jgi:tetratricopeptide (TPR) repeat protein
MAALDSAEGRRGGFVGRDREMAELNAGLRAALAGRGCLFVIGGEAGVGKTRLAEEVARVAEKRGARILWARCWEAGGAPAFWPWVQIVRGYLRDARAATFRAAMGADLTRIARIVPELRAELADVDAAHAFEGDDERFQLFDAMATFLTRGARRQPLVLMLDDLHAADTPSLLFLRFLARDLGQSAMLVLAAHRSSESERNFEVDRLLAEIGRDGRRISLGGLSESELAHLIERRVGVSISARSLADLHRLTDGNPFFVSEVLRLLASEPRTSEITELSPEHLRVPFGVRGAIERRLEPLSGAARDTLELAAAIGQDFDLDVLERASSTERGALLAGLDEAVAARLVTPSLLAGRPYRFSHGLIRATLYESLGAARRTSCHRRIAEALEDLRPVRSKISAAELAHHFFEASAGVDRIDKVIDYAIEAGAEAVAQLAYEDAPGHYERALHALDRLGPAPAARRFDVLLALARARASAGHREAAKETFRRAIDLARRLNAPSKLALAVLGFPQSSAGQGGPDGQLIEYLEEALAGLSREDSALRARVLARLAVELHYSARGTRTLPLIEESVAMARRSGDPYALAVVLIAIHWVRLGPGTTPQRLAVADEILALAARGGHRGLAALGHTCRIADLLELGAPADVDAGMRAQEQLAEALRQPRHLWLAQQFRAMRALLEGRFQDAEPLIEQGLIAGRRAGDPAFVGVFEAQMYVLRREQGRLAEVEESIKTFTERFPTIATGRTSLALVHTELGREADARLDFEMLAAHEFRDFPHDELWLHTMTDLAELCARFDDRRRAEALFDLLRPYAGQNAVIGAGILWHGPIAYYLALLATVLSRWEEAAAFFADARAMCVRMGAKPFLARTLCDQARMLLARGEPAGRERAIEALDDALEVARALGMNSLLDKARRLRAKAGESRHTAIEPAADALQVIRKEGDYWTIRYEGRIVQIQDAAGVRYIAHLLHHPGVEIHAMDLVALSCGREPPAQAAPRAELGARRTAGLGDAGEFLDPKAKAAYRRQLEDLRAAYDEAIAFGDRGRAERAGREIERLTDELARCVGLGGRDRKAASASERARVSVTKAISTALRRISAQDAALGGHLTAAIKTGTFCSYAAEPGNPIVSDT